jgi:hypothetical protein
MRRLSRDPLVVASVGCVAITGLLELVLFYGDNEECRPILWHQLAYLGMLVCWVAAGVLFFAGKDEATVLDGVAVVVGMVVTLVAAPIVFLAGIDGCWE